VQCVVTYATDTRSYLTSVLIHEYLIFDTYHPDTSYLREQGCEDPWLFFRSHKVSASKKLWETLAYCIDVAFLRCVLVPAVRAVQFTCPPCNMRVTVQESMCRFSGDICWEVLMKVADTLQFWL
jgi:predicted RNA-binding Zn-ribbon protein involved in translation (DUF1610 family)